MTVYCPFAQCDRWILQSRPAQVMKSEGVGKGTLKTHFTHCHLTFMQNYKQGYICNIVFVCEYEKSLQAFLQFKKGERFKLFIVGFVLMQ